MFTLDCNYLLYIDSNQTLITYCLHRMAPIRHLACHAEQLLVLPVKHNQVLMTSWPVSACPDVTLWDFHQGRQLVSLSSVAAGGIRDMSKDGRLAVDANLQVFSLDTGQMRSQVDHNVDADRDFTFVRLTYDGEHVVWVDKLSVKVSRVCDGSLIAQTCTHERPTSLCTLDYGYVLVVGGEDGRILMMKLLPVSQRCFVGRPHSAEERSSIIHSSEACTDRVRASFDTIYQSGAHSVRDGELPRASESTRCILAHRAKAPLLSTAKLKMVDAAADKYLRSYSQMTPISDLSEGGALTGASSYHDIVSSTDESVAVHRRSCDDSAVVMCGSESAMFTDRRSRSVTDVMALCTLQHRDAAASPTAPVTSPPPLRTPAHKFLSYLSDFGATIRSRRRKHRRRQAAADANNRDRMPSV